MTFKIVIHPEEEDRLGAILMDIITSAAYFKRREIKFQQEEDNISFIFLGHCPNEYFTYLTEKYDISLNYIDVLNN